MRHNGAESLNGTFSIVELYLFESGRYNDRFLRSLKFGSITDGVVDRLSEEILRTNGRGFSSGSIANNRTPVIQLDDKVDRNRDRLEIARGFDQKRFCFIMKIIEAAASSHHGDRVYLVSGYTDKMEYSRFSKSIPDDLEFVVNSLLETTSNRSSNSSQLFGYGNAMATSDRMYMLRPQDVISKYSFTKSNHGEGVKSSFRSDHISGRSINTNSRQNTITSTYLSRTLTGLHKNRMEVMGEDAVRDRDNSSDNPAHKFLLGNRSRDNNSRAGELEDELERVRSVVSEDASDEFDFLREIRRAARSTSNAGVFTFRQLTKICPDVSNVIQVSVMREQATSRTGLFTSDDQRIGDMDGREWGESLQEEIVATNVSNAFVAACTTSFIFVIDIIFALKYDDIEGKLVWDFEIAYDDNGRDRQGSIVFAEQVSDKTELELIDRFAWVMIEDVLNAYTRYGHEMMVSVRYNMNREIFINVAIDTDKPYELCTPIFCDAITSPTQTTSESASMRLGEGAVQLYQEIFRAIKG